MRNKTVSRREFLKATAGCAAALSFSRLPSAAVIGANERIHFGIIGCGNMGTGHLRSLVKRSETDNIRVLAVSDVYQRRVTRAKEICKGDGYLDYRKLLGRKDVDAVLIATPDHWHAKLSIDAMAAGKDVYVEKPMTHTIGQALELRDSVKRYKKILQVGPNATANDGYWQAREAIVAGRIGKATWAHASYNRNARTCLFNAEPFIPDPKAGPHATGEDFIDWDMWLGHKWGLAPKIPWNAEHFFRFRKYWAYGGGVATDLLFHKLAPLLIAMAGPNGEFPIRVNANGGLYVEKDGRDIPDTFMMTADYPSEWSAFLISTLTNDTQIQDRIYGKYGTMEFGSQVTLRVNGDFSEEFKARNQGKSEITLTNQPRRDLEGNFIDVLRGKGTLNCNVDLGAATMVAIALAIKSYRERKAMRWEAKNERATS